MGEIDGRVDADAAGPHDGHPLSHIGPMSEDVHVTEHVGKIDAG